MYKDVELRKLPAGHLCRIADILETNNDWRKVMSQIPKDLLSKTSEPKYNNEHMRLIEEHAKQTNRKCAEILFDEWGTSGRVRPTLNTLYNMILKAEIFRAADEIAIIMKESLPVRPTDGPAAVVDTDITLLINDISMEYPNSNQQRPNGVLNNDSTAQMLSSSNIPIVIESLGNKTTAQVKSASDLIKFSQQSSNIPDFDALLPPSQSDQVCYNNSQPSAANSTVPVLDYLPPFPAVDITKIDTTILNNRSLTHFEYNVLAVITNKFAENLTKTAKGPVGKIGSGGFGDVYVGYHKKLDKNLAVKRFRMNLIYENRPHVAVKIFNSEVKALAQLRHHNIVPIIGYSADGPLLCVVCEYVDGGSLETNLAERKLNEKHRFLVMSGTADGLKYIHRCVKPPAEDDIYEESASGSKKNFLHGDVKSANILLTSEYVPKLCDFGLAKNVDSTFITSSLMGTSAYMAPEGFSGTVTQKTDIYSYGIVLLELLTGLRPIVVDDNETINIKDYVEENAVDGNITKLLDPAMCNWQQAEQIYELAKKCLSPQRNARPSIEQVCDTLYKINLEY
ncbi:interleukin-1 receptor-associated kinase 4-like [Achroia grisella]|uniref:interleukin-1 receptor-associated kinase 4-like n=1 Tax=Achroia grisella TaxID=688607 RepID=UPI0027D2EC3F|nr:interleukin-1 receptor-associated kinase 4-like [Achroia grisella]